MDDRKASVLRAIVEHYIETDQPVGSGRVASRSDVAVSSATVRSDMALLEQEGYLAQPHTSAGRIPTEKGYRFFVDQIAGERPIDQATAQQVRAFFRHAHGELEELLTRTSTLLSGVTDLAAVVVGPPTESTVVRSVQVVPLTPSLGLVVVVFSDGRVEKHTFELDAALGDADAERVKVSLAAALDGRTIASARRPGPVGDPDLDVLAARVLRMLTDPGQQRSEPVFVGGTAAVAARFDAVETIGEVLGLLEKQYLVVTLLRDLLDRGLSVAIGSETGVTNLAECSVVVAPYAVDGEELGSIGVLGPTRMDYHQAMAAVALVSRRLGRAIGDG